MRQLLREWSRDPILRWALIVPAVILVPFVCYLAGQRYLVWYVVHYRDRIIQLSSEAHDLAAEKWNRAAYHKYMELLAYAGTSDPGSDETRKAVETAQAESDRLYQLVKGELEDENVQSRKDVGQISAVVTITLSAVVVVSIILYMYVQEDNKRARAKAVATKCPSCQQLSALSQVGEEIVSQTPRIKTVTRRSTGVAMFNGQIIPTFHSEDVQVVVYDVVFRGIYKCKFCNKESMSKPLQREVQP